MDVIEAMVAARKDSITGAALYAKFYRLYIVCQLLMVNEQSVAWSLHDWLSGTRYRSYILSPQPLHREARFRPPYC